MDQARDEFWCDDGKYRGRCSLCKLVFEAETLPDLKKVAATHTTQRHPNPLGVRYALEGLHQKVS